MIDDLLDLSRLEAGATPFSPRPVDLNRLLQALVNDRMALAAKRSLSLSIECDPGLPPAVGDERLLAQVFTNLLTNAMNYTPGGGKIRLRTKRRKGSDGEWVTAEVRDTGPGIPPEEQPLLFRRFFRGRASHASGASGTGLGLAICKEIAELHGGRITVESESQPGEGARFTVWIPAVPGSPCHPPPPVRPTQDGGSGEATCHSPRARESSLISPSPGVTTSGARCRIRPNSSWRAERPELFFHCLSPGLVCWTEVHPELTSRFLR